MYAQIRPDLCSGKVMGALGQHFGRVRVSTTKEHIKQVSKKDSKTFQKRFNRSSNIDPKLSPGPIKRRANSIENRVSFWDRFLIPQMIQRSNNKVLTSQLKEHVEQYQKTIPTSSQHGIDINVKTYKTKQQCKINT